MASVSRTTHLAPLELGFPLPNEPAFRVDLTEQERYLLLLQAIQNVTGGGGGGGGGGVGYSTTAKQDVGNASLASILAKIISGPATEAKQDAHIAATHTDLLAILAKLTADPATQTTLAAILTKLSASLAVTGTFWQATQPVSLAAAPAGVSTEALQTALNALVTTLTGKTLDAGASATVSSIADEASHILKASAGRLSFLYVYNAGPTQWIQLHNSATLPVEGAVPLLPLSVPTATGLALDIPVTGLPFSTGITVCNSSTKGTKTIGSANCWFVAVVLP